MARLFAVKTSCVALNMITKKQILPSGAEAPLKTKEIFLFDSLFPA